LGRVTATARRVTVFLEVSSQEQAAAGYFDDVFMIPYPCPPRECQLEPQQPPPEKRACVDWKGEREPRTLQDEYSKADFTFKSLTTLPLMIVTWGDPPGQGKLQFPERGMQVMLPFSANRAVADVVSYTGRPIRMAAFDADGQKLGEALSPANSSGKITPLEIAVEGMQVLVFSGGGNEGLLIDLCVFQENPKSPPGNPPAGGNLPAGDVPPAGGFPPATGIPPTGGKPPSGGIKRGKE